MFLKVIPFILLGLGFIQRHRWLSELKVAPRETKGIRYIVQKTMHQF